MLACGSQAAKHGPVGALASTARASGTNACSKAIKKAGGAASSNIVSAVVRNNKKRPRSNGNGNTTLERAKKESGLHKPSSTDRSALWSRALALETDKDNLNEYSCFVREQLELFCDSQEEIDHIRETNYPKYRNGGNYLVAGQVGLRCKDCQQKTSFTSNLSVVNKITRNFVRNHLLKGCNEMDKESRKKLCELKRSFGGHQGGNNAKKKGSYTADDYVANCLQGIGIHQVSDKPGLFLLDDQTGGK